jgi:tRNA dimethylallyltransferase
VTRSSDDSSGHDARSAPPIALVGATATGKTAVGILVAERLGTEIIGCDSRQVYRGLAVGSAQPTAAERARVRHHLVGAVDPGVRYSAAAYRDAVLALLPHFASRRRVPLFVGGTGLYLRAALKGLCSAPPGIPAMRQWLAALAPALPGGLHPLLASVDPEAAARIHPHDRYRLTRALEVYHLSGRPITEHQVRHRAALPSGAARVFAIELAAVDLRARIARRLETMMSSGLLDETRHLLEAGLDPALPALRAVGYPELFAHLRGETSLDEALEHVRRATWQYARRQMTWFRAEPGIVWLSAGADSPAEQLAEALLRHPAASAGAA